MVEGIEDKNAFGWHNFLRYAVPGYVFILFFLIGIWILYQPKDIAVIASSNVSVLVSNLTILIAGYFVGFLVYVFYDAAYTWLGGKEKRAHVRCIRALLRGSEKQLKHFEARAIWDSILFENKSGLKDRILFVSNIAQTYGQIAIAVFLAVAGSLLHYLVLRGPVSDSVVYPFFLLEIVMIIMIILTWITTQPYYFRYLDSLETCFFTQNKEAIQTALDSFLKQKKVLANYKEEKC